MNQSITKIILSNKYLMYLIKSFINLKIKYFKDLHKYQKPKYFLKNTLSFGPKTLCWTFQKYYYTHNIKYNINFLDENEVLESDIEDDTFCFDEEWINIHKKY